MGRLKQRPQHKIDRLTSESRSLEPCGICIESKPEPNLDMYCSQIYGRGALRQKEHRQFGQMEDLNDG